MFLVDDILMAPARGLLWVFKEIHHAVEQEQANEAEAITAKLSELYMMLETGQMTETEFDASEKTLLDRLDAIKEAAADEGNEEDDEEVVILERPPKKQRRRKKRDADAEVFDGFAATKAHPRTDGNPGSESDSRLSP